MRTYSEFKNKILVKVYKNYLMKNTDFFCISRVININDTILQRYKSVVEFDIDNDLDERLYRIIKLKYIYLYKQLLFVFLYS